ncbi:unnamed protein product [Musa acuminata var. zebrina]
MSLFDWRHQQLPQQFMYKLTDLTCSPPPVSFFPAFLGTKMPKKRKSTKNRAPECSLIGIRRLLAILAVTVRNRFTNLIQDRWIYGPSALDMRERRLGRGWKSALRRCWWEDGRMRAARARFTHSPSTAPIRTREFVIAERRALRRLDGEETAAWWMWRPLWSLQRKEPGWVVGAQRQVRRTRPAVVEGERLSAAARDRPGEVERSREKRTAGF